MTEIEEIAQEIADHAMATSRKPSEILQCMIDEGYVEMDDEAIAECLRLVALAGVTQFVSEVPQ